jgi:YidC/Oxa1 family membrane protein insertase
VNTPPLANDGSTAGVLKTLQSIGSPEQAKQLAASLSANTPSAAALFCAGAAHERAGNLPQARAAYQRVVAADTAAFKRSAEFRLAALDVSDAKLQEAKFHSLAGQKPADGLFYVGGAWTATDTKRAALQGLMDLRAQKKSIRLFNYLRSKSFFPPPYAYLFILLALAVAIKLLSLPFLVHGAKVSLAIPRLRGEYQRLKTRHAGDALGFSSAVTQLYKRHGINPSAGCAKIIIDIGFVVWVMLTLRNYAPQLTLDGAKFLWVSSVTERDVGVLVMWMLAGLLMLFLTPQIEQGQTAQLACASLAVLGIIAGAAWYWSWPAYLMIFWTVLSLFTAVVHFVTIGVLATRS